MNVAFAPRAVADLSNIGARSRRLYGDAVAAVLETYLRAARLFKLPPRYERRKANLARFGNLAA